MRRIDIERSDEGNENEGNSMMWWAWLIPFVLVGILIAIIVPVIFAGNRPPVPNVGIQQQQQQAPQQQAQQPLNLDTVLSTNNLPREFAYGGMTWRAVDAGRYEQAGRDLIAIGPSVQGNDLYYEQGTPTNPYETLYLKGKAQGYNDVYVMYKPTSQMGAQQGQQQQQQQQQQAMNVDTVLSVNNLPRQFTMNGMTWQAMDAGRYEQQGRNLVGTGQQVQGHNLYYEQGMPTNPYQALYLKGDAQGYNDVYVMYQPMSGQSGS